jgi:putative sterol carrier protein
MCKLLATEFADKCMYQCLQFFGGYGFMEEYKVARAYRDCRIGTIGGGTSEIMREIIAKMVIDDVSYEKAGNERRETEENAPQTVAGIFSTLAGRFKSEKAASKGIKLLMHFKFSSCEYSVGIDGGKLTVDSGLKGEPNCLVETDDETYVAVETGKINPQEAFMTGKIKVSDLMSMMNFGSLFKRL